jgi:site-specific recombinase XerD
VASLCFYDADALATLDDVASRTAALQMLDRFACVDGAPFFLDEHGVPLRDVNSWLDDLPRRGSRSLHTARAYAHDWHTWQRFLEARGREIYEVDSSDIQALYHDRRVRTDGPRRQVTASTWNRWVNSLQSFYHWAVRAGRIAAPPFDYELARRPMSGGGAIIVKSNQARERTGRAFATLMWLERDQLEVFVNVGLSELKADGTSDSRARGRNLARNRAVGELMSSGGLRAQEASHLLIHEIPQPPNTAQERVRLDLPAPICKGAIARFTLVAPSALLAIHSYIRTERRFAPIRCPKNALVASSGDRDGALIGGRRIRWSVLTLADRRRLVDETGRPLIWALSERGDPMTDWSYVFRQASNRCRASDAYFPKVTPHTMRHTFAVHTLRWLIARLVARLSRIDDAKTVEMLAPYWRAHDPLLTLRDLLGHASVTTTQMYLRAADVTRLYAEAIGEDDDG